MKNIYLLIVLQISAIYGATVLESDRCYAKQKDNTFRSKQIGGKPIFLDNSIPTLDIAKKQVAWSKNMSELKGYTDGIYKTIDNTFLLINRNKHFVYIGEINTSGSHLWNKTIEFSEGDHITGILPIQSEGTIFISRVVTDKFKKMQGYLSKLNKQGEMIWDKDLNLSRINYQSMIELENKDIVLLGYTKGKDTNRIIKLNSNGQEIWNKEYNQKYRFVSAISEIPNGNILLGINRLGGTSLIWIDDNGTITRNMDLNCSYPPVIRKLYELNNGNILLSGDSSQLGAGVCEVSKEGKILWNRRIGQHEKDMVTAMMELPNKNKLLGGNFYNKTKKQFEGHLIEINKNGLVIKDIIFPQLSIITNAKKVSNGNIFLYGFKIQNGKDNQTVLIKYKIK